MTDISSNVPESFRYFFIDEKLARSWSHHSWGIAYHEKWIKGGASVMILVCQNIRYTKARKMGGQCKNEKSLFLSTTSIDSYLEKDQEVQATFYSSTNLTKTKRWSSWKHGGWMIQQSGMQEKKTILPQVKLIILTPSQSISNGRTTDDAQPSIKISMWANMLTFCIVLPSPN